MFHNFMNKLKQPFPIMHSASAHCSCHLSLVLFSVFINADFPVIKSSRKKGNLPWCCHLFDRRPGGAVLLCWLISNTKEKGRKARKKQFDRPKVDKRHLSRHLETHGVTAFVGAFVKSHVFHCRSMITITFFFPSFPFLKYGFCLQLCGTLVSHFSSSSSSTERSCIFYIHVIGKMSRSTLN